MENPYDLFMGNRIALGLGPRGPPGSLQSTRSHMRSVSPIGLRMLDEKKGWADGSLT